MKTRVRGLLSVAFLVPAAILSQAAVNSATVAHKADRPGDFSVVQQAASQVALIGAPATALDVARVHAPGGANQVTHDLAWTATWRADQAAAASLAIAVAAAFVNA